MRIKLSQSDWQRIGEDMGWMKGAFSAAEDPPAAVEPEHPAVGKDETDIDTPAPEGGCGPIVERVNALTTKAKRIDMGRDTEIAKVLAAWTRGMALAIRPAKGIFQTPEPSPREGFRSDERSLNSLGKALKEFQTWMDGQEECDAEKRSAAVKATSDAVDFCERQMRLVAKYNRIGRRVM